MPKIYTKTGDKGETGLWGGRRVSKNHPQVRAYGEVDELNSVLGLAAAALPPRKNLDGLRRSLARVQEELFALGAILATPADEVHRLAPTFNRCVPAERLESEIDKMTAEIKPLKRFILPGGADAASWRHFARCVCRRAEREVVALREHAAPGSKNPPDVPDGVIVYLNRLSDFLFTAARWVNYRLKYRETEWLGLKQ
jgi:cob(I)alamin adenosyltransferase